MVLLRLLALFLLLGPAAAQDRFFDAGGARIRYVDTGAGPAVVLVHGFTGSIERSWVNTHPTVHERGLPRRPELAQAIRRWIAK